MEREVTLQTEQSEIGNRGRKEDRGVATGKKVSSSLDLFVLWFQCNSQEEVPESSWKLRPKAKAVRTETKSD